jgi:alpha-tubulin suppressor-like RCC1 family protein
MQSQLIGTFLVVACSLTIAGATAPLHAGQIAVGASHSCAITERGGVKCWGGNWLGQLGDGTATERLTAGFVRGLNRGVGAIAAGYYHTCALVGGGVRCWGQNNNGQLGDRTTTDRYMPVIPRGLRSGVLAIGAGAYHTCAVLSTGGLKCWGDNNKGQLGDRRYNDRYVPGYVDGLRRGVTAVAGGFLHTCALTSRGGVKCWGWNKYGEVGIGTTNGPVSSPQDVLRLRRNATAVATGDGHSCARIYTGRVKCWGWNPYGQLGDRTTTQRTSPVFVAGLGSAVISANGYSSCAVTSTGAAKCWGNNLNGQLGDGTQTPRNIPTFVYRLRAGVAEIAIGRGHGCALLSMGGAKCWGYNLNGQLGNATKTNSLIPVAVMGFK